MEQEAKRQRVSQSQVPRASLSDASVVPRALYEQYAGAPTPPLQVAQAANISPTSSRWRDITGAAIAYGLTEGGGKAPNIEITDLGRRIVAPQTAGDDLIAMREAALLPVAIRTFLQKYHGAQFPREDIAKNVLEQACGVPRKSVDRTFDLIHKTADEVGFLQKIKGATFVDINGTTMPTAPDSVESAESVSLDENGAAESGSSSVALDTQSDARTRRVFISHGKNRAIADQLKDIIKFGKREPVLAVEEETASRPVPQKVMDAMRSCLSGIIHVESEEVMEGEDGSPKHRLNENVLIEIGAALALYMPNLILLVEEGVQLPSNLQGLYVCGYSGDKLDGDATMKVLKAFNDFV